MQAYVQFTCCSSLNAGLLQWTSTHVSIGVAKNAQQSACIAQNNNSITDVLAECACTKLSTRLNKPFLMKNTFSKQKKEQWKHATEVVSMLQLARDCLCGWVVRVRLEVTWPLQMEGHWFKPCLTDYGSLCGKVCNFLWRRGV